MENLMTVFVFAFGAIIGSFLNVIIWRLPRGESLLGRSHCPSCNKTLSPLELFPLLSFVWQKGRCRNCRKGISSRYFVIEALTGLLFAAAWWLIHPEGAVGYLLLAKSLLVIAVFMVVFVIDLEHYLILDNVVFPAAAVVLLLNLAIDLSAKTPLLDFDSMFVSGLIAAIAATFPFFFLWAASKGQWMGFGDVKFAVFLGLGLGWPKVAVCLLAAILLGGAVSAILLVFSKKTLKSQVPFGTFLSLAGLVSLFYGETMLRWYLAFLGF